MPEKYTVKITPQAQEQLREIIGYINYTLQAPGTAMKMLDTLEKEIASLDQFPNRVPLTEEEPWLSPAPATHNTGAFSPYPLFHTEGS